MSMLMSEKDETLTIVDRYKIVRQAEILISEFYAHLIQKKAARAIRPLQELRLLREELDNGTQTDGESGTDLFHERMIEIFLGLKDGHTRYRARRSLHIRLPFNIERYHQNGKDIYVALGVREHAADLDGFQSGVQITHWNQVPIALAIVENGRHFYGANPAAVFRQGMRYLTQRNLAETLRPKEEAVCVSYIGPSGPGSCLFSWQASDDGGDTPLESDDDNSAQEQSLDNTLDSIQKADRLDDKKIQRLNPLPVSDMSIESCGGFPENSEIAAEIIRYRQKAFGYLRIRKFTGPSVEKSIAAIKLMSVAEVSGLIIDLRANPGGKIDAMERLVRFVGAAEWRVPFQFRLTSESRKLTQNITTYTPWRSTLESRGVTGDVYSQIASFQNNETHSEEASSLSTERLPMILIVDALSYSAADMFAALFKDNHLGLVIGPDARTGAGGANGVTHESLPLCFPDFIGNQNSIDADVSDPVETDRASFLRGVSGKLEKSARFQVLRKIPVMGNMQSMPRIFEVFDEKGMNVFEVRIAMGDNGYYKTHWYRLERGEVSHFTLIDSPLDISSPTENDLKKQIISRLGQAAVLRGRPFDLDGNTLFTYQVAEKRFKCLYRAPEIFIIELTKIAVRQNGLERLPGQTGLTVSLLRSLRSGEHAGLPLEDLGVMVDKIYLPTFQDLVNDHIDLKRFTIDLFPR